MPAHTSCSRCGLIFHREELDDNYTCDGCLFPSPGAGVEGAPETSGWADHPPFSPPPPEPPAAEA